MIALIQRVREAQVDVDGETVGRIGPGLLAFVAVQPDDGEAQTQRMIERLLGYRVFADAEGKMNLSLADTGGGLLLVSQFTLAADTTKGMRPSFYCGRRARSRAALVRAPGGIGKNSLCTSGNRPVWHPYGSGAGQRRARYLLARSLVASARSPLSRLHSRVSGVS